ncbi:hypothetical protein RDI58_014845 [Solanum bulbocastanum]|uniref:Uncharacterized protein n=1 Tax=Solanum bulbocastanum TaxID=147425 RepID=A0AAN8TEE1_SOLBU
MRDRYGSRGRPLSLVEAQGDALPDDSSVSLVLEEVRKKRSLVIVVPPPKTGEQGMREEVQLLTKMVSINEQ